MARRSKALGSTDDKAPGESREGLQSYVLGLGMAIILTAASFWVAQTDFIWRPGAEKLRELCPLSFSGVVNFDLQHRIAAQ